MCRVMASMETCCLRKLPRSHRAPSHHAQHRCSYPEGPLLPTPTYQIVEDDEHLVHQVREGRCGHFRTLVVHPLDGRDQVRQETLLCVTHVDCAASPEGKVWPEGCTRNPSEQG